MQIAAVIGHPIGHSLSPMIHEYWLKERRIPGEYRAHDVRPEELQKRIKEFAAEGYTGINVTLPHKEAVLEICDDLSQAVQAIGAANTLVFANKKIYADNTDADGFADHLMASVPDHDFTTAIILGAGGAARAIVFALKNLGVEFFTIHNRDVSRGEKLLDELGVSGVAMPLAEKLEAADILVNCTSLGMTGQPELKIDLAPLDKKAIVADIVYKPLKTQLLRQAEKRGHPTVDGLGMLIHQAAAAFEQFYGEEAGEVVKLREILERKLG